PAVTRPPFTYAQPTGADQGTHHHHQQSGTAQRVPGHALLVQLRLSERCQSEAHGEHRLLSWDDGGSDRCQTDRQRLAITVAGAGDGSARDRRSVRQWLCLRVSELPLVVVANHASAGGSASAYRL